MAAGDLLPEGEMDSPLQGIALEALRQQEARNEALKQLGAAEASLEKATAESQRILTYQPQLHAYPPWRIRVPLDLSLLIAVSCSAAALVLGISIGSVWRINSELPPINSTQPQP